MMSGNWWRGVLWLMVLAVGLYVVLRIRSTLTVFGLGFFFAYMLNPLVERLEGQKLGPIKKLSRGGAIAVVYLLILGFVVAAAFLVVPLAVDQTEDMIHSAPAVIAKLQRKAYELQQHWMTRVPEAVRSSVEETLSSSVGKLSYGIGVSLQILANFFLSALSGLFFFATGLLVAVFLLSNWAGVLQSAVQAFPPSYRDDVRELGGQMNKIFGGYLKATILTSSACGAVTFALLFVAAMAFRAGSYPSLLVSIVAAFTYPIPVVGILFSSILGGVLAYGSSSSFAFAAVALGIVFGVNQAIDRTIAPKLMSDAIGVSPLFVLFAAFAGGEFLGVTGMLLGIPLAAMAKAVFTWFHGRFLVDPAELQAHSTAELWKQAARVPRPGPAAPAPAPSQEGDAWSTRAPDSGDESAPAPPPADKPEAGPPSDRPEAGPATEGSAPVPAE
ncbi:MAG: AI-2E family transporter [Candidatus Eremiobacterota bacterium]